MWASLLAIYRSSAIAATGSASNQHSRKKYSTLYSLLEWKLANLELLVKASATSTACGLYITQTARGLAHRSTSSSLHHSNLQSSFPFPLSSFFLHNFHYLCLSVLQSNLMINCLIVRCQPFIVISLPFNVDLLFLVVWYNFHFNSVLLICLILRFFSWVSAR